MVGVACQKEVVVFALVVAGLFVFFILRDERHYSSKRYVYLDTTRAKQEIDQSYLLLISNVEETFSATKDKADDFVEELRDQWIRAPTGNRSYEVSDIARAPELCWSGADCHIMRELLRSEKNGFFVECCDFKHENNSARTLFLEETCGWQGLLLAPAREQFKMLATQNRRVFLTSFTLPPVGVEAIRVPDAKVSPYATSWAQFQLKSAPLDILLQAVNRPRLSLLVLHAHGREMEILAAIPFGKLDIQAITVPQTQHTDQLEDFLGKKGYKKWEKGSKDVVFYRGANDSRTRSRKVSAF